MFSFPLPVGRLRGLRCLPCLLFAIKTQIMGMDTYRQAGLYVLLPDHVFFQTLVNFTRRKDPERFRWDHRGGQC